jgi:hypothetical protein
MQGVRQIGKGPASTVKRETTWNSRNNTERLSGTSAKAIQEGLKKVNENGSQFSLLFLGWLLMFLRDRGCASTFEFSRPSSQRQSQRLTPLLGFKHSLWNAMGSSYPCHLQHH